MKWRPIKTAPKDRLVLLSCEENPEYDPYVCVGRWIDVPHSNSVHALLRGDFTFLREDIKTIDDLNRVAKQDAHWMDGYPGIMRGGMGGVETYSYELRGCILFRPTHWMPLPKPPVKRVNKSQLSR